LLIKSKANLISFLSISVVFVLAVGCKSNQFHSNKLRNLASEITELKGKLAELESDFKSSNKEEKSIKGTYIKSITFRGVKEDYRLRIYWKNGHKTDLPCSKEENSLWACG